MSLSISRSPMSSAGARAGLVAKIWRVRDFALAMSILPFVVAVPPGHAQQSPNELVIVTSGGTFEKALRRNFYDAFTSETGIKIKEVAASYAEQWAKARAMAQSGQTEWDIVTVGVGEETSNRELLFKLDCSKMPRIGTDAIPNTCRDYSVLRTIGGTVLVYNTKTFPRERAPGSWKDFWNVKDFPGPRAIPNYGAPYVPMALSLVADGVDAKDITGKPIDVTRALRKLDEIKSSVPVWWKTGDQSQQAIRSGEVVMAMMWSGRALQLQQSGQPVELVWATPSVELSSWGILRNAQNKDAAMKFLNFYVTRPEAHQAFSKEVFWDTANRDSIQKTYGSVDLFTKRIDGMITYDAMWLAANRESIGARWNEWVSR